MILYGRSCADPDLKGAPMRLWLKLELHKETAADLAVVAKLRDPDRGDQIGATMHLCCLLW